MCNGSCLVIVLIHKPYLIQLFQQVPQRKSNGDGWVGIETNGETGPASVHLLWIDGHLARC